MSQYNLAELFEKYQIKNISTDSRRIKADDAFFALKGTTFDGNKYIIAALDAGAKIIFKQLDTKLDIGEDQNIKLGDKIFYVPNIKQALAKAIDLLYPNLPKFLIAVTGTSGKTSVVAYCHQLLSFLGQSSVSIGTLGVRCSEEALENELSQEGNEALNTLDVLSLRKLLSKAADKSVDFVTFEASSHGLDQQRLGNLKVQAAALVSFGHDHLDYHKTSANYLQAKLKLFSNHLVAAGLAVINKDTQDSAIILKFLEERNIKPITVGRQADLKIISTEQTLQGQKIELSYQNKNYQIISPIIGSYQASNMLLAALLVASVTAEKNITIEKIFAHLPKLKAVKGRLQKIAAEDYSIFVDYAHKPDALKNSLLELKKLKSTNKKLIVVFGCGGNRDTEKRRLMGEVANQFADIIIVTDDNPRYEDPQIIRRAILAGAGEALEIEDRYQAIKKAIEILSQGDILLVAGKGHEKYQVIGEQKYAFDDAAVIEQILQERCK